MKMRYEAMAIYSGAILGRVMEYGLKYLDAQVTPAAAHIWEKASFWANVVVAALPPLLMLGKSGIFKGYEYPVLAIGATAAGNLIPYVEGEFFPPAQALRRTYTATPRRTTTRTGPVSTGGRVVVI
jgi:hypothetical protein